MEAACREVGCLMERLQRAIRLESEWCVKRAGYGVVADCARLHRCKDIEAMATAGFIRAARNHERLRRLVNRLSARLRQAA